MSTIRTSNFGPLTGNTASVVDPSTPVNGIARISPLVNCPSVLTNTGATSFTIASGLPTWIRRVTVAFSTLTISASTNPIVQLVAGGSTVTTGYFSQCGYTGASNGTTNFTNGFGIRGGGPGAGDYHGGTLTLFNTTGNTWAASVIGGMYSGGNYTIIGGGYVALSNPLTGLILTSSGGATTFSNGNVTVFYE